VFGSDEAWALKLRDVHHIGDFRRWREPDAYRKALGRLLRDLGGRKELTLTSGISSTRIEPI
jgi:hypothetical protein